jgi:hypothetical protein
MGTEMDFDETSAHAVIAPIEEAPESSETLLLPLMGLRA